VDGEVQLFALGAAIKRKFVAGYSVGAGKILARHAEGGFAAGREIEHDAHTSATLRVGAFHLRLRAAAHENGSYQSQGSDQCGSVNDQVLHAMLRSVNVRVRGIGTGQILSITVLIWVRATVPAPGTANRKDSTDRTFRLVPVLLHVHNVRHHRRHDVRDAVKDRLPHLRREHRQR
jgi:hypothetical protein